MPSNFCLHEPYQHQLQHLILSKRRHFLTRIRSYLSALLRAFYHLCRKQRYEWVDVTPQFPYHPSGATEPRIQPIYTGIGVGVYQGSHVILRGLAKDYFSQDWVVERLRSDNLRHISKQSAWQLYLLALKLVLLLQSDQLQSDSLILNETGLEFGCPLSTQPRSLESSSEVVCDSDDCPVQKLLRRLLKQDKQSQYLLCPLSPLIRTKTEFHNEY